MAGSAEPVCGRLARSRIADNKQPRALGSGSHRGEEVRPWLLVRGDSEDPPTLRRAADGKLRTFSHFLRNHFPNRAVFVSFGQEPTIQRLVNDGLLKWQDVNVCSEII